MSSICSVEEEFQTEKLATGVLKKIPVGYVVNGPHGKKRRTKSLKTAKAIATAWEAEYQRKLETTSVPGM